MQTDSKLQFGKHWMRMEEDILYFKYVGMITVPDIQTSMPFLEQKFQPGVTYYIICDVSEVTGMEAAARARARFKGESRPTAPRPLDRFAVTIENGIVHVDTSTPIQRDQASEADLVYAEGGV